MVENDVFVEKGIDSNTIFLWYRKGEGDSELIKLNYTQAESLYYRLGFALEQNEEGE